MCTGCVEQKVRKRPRKLQDPPEGNTEQPVEGAVVIKRPARHLCWISYLRIETVDNGFYFELLVSEFRVKCLQFAKNEVSASLERSHIIVSIVKHHTQIFKREPRLVRFSIICRCR